MRNKLSHRHIKLSSKYIDNVGRTGISKESQYRIEELDQQGHSGIIVDSYNKEGRIALFARDNTKAFTIKVWYDTKGIQSQDPYNGFVRGLHEAFQVSIRGAKLPVMSAAVKAAISYKVANIGFQGCDFSSHISENSNSFAEILPILETSKNIEFRECSGMENYQFPSKFWNNVAKSCEIKLIAFRKTTMAPSDLALWIKASSQFPQKEMKIYYTFSEDQFRNREKYNELCIFQTLVDKVNDESLDFCHEILSLTDDPALKDCFNKDILGLVGEYAQACNVNFMYLPDSEY